jgi:hypothetical protein
MDGKKRKETMEEWMAIPIIMALMVFPFDSLVNYYFHPYFPRSAQTSRQFVRLTGITTTEYSLSELITIILEQKSFYYEV